MLSQKKPGRNLDIDLMAELTQDLKNFELVQLQMSARRRSVPLTE